ncbi:MAG: FixH family protein [Proteobacteria bacterium]|nr:FixH family protein [Pseudomonadota bacterium]
MFRRILLLAILPGMLLSALQASEVNSVDLQTTTESGISVQIVSDMSPIGINQIHSWHLTLTDSTGNPLTGAGLTLIGGMPDHDHGLPTLPLITEQAQAGTYLLEGVRFHMPGKWQITLTIIHHSGTETAVIDLQL